MLKHEAKLIDADADAIVAALSETTAAANKRCRATAGGRPGEVAEVRARGRGRAGRVRDVPRREGRRARDAGARGVVDRFGRAQARRDSRAARRTRRGQAVAQTGRAADAHPAVARVPGLRVPAVRGQVGSDRVRVRVRGGGHAAGAGVDGRDVRPVLRPQGGTRCGRLEREPARRAVRPPRTARRGRVLARRKPRRREGGRQFRFVLGHSGTRAPR